MGKRDKKGEDLWYLQLDFDWMDDKKLIRLSAKYGKAILVDVINTFILMAKCDGVANMKDPAHAKWAKNCIGKSGKALYATFDKLAEFKVINPEMWEKLCRVTNDRACADVERRKESSASRQKQTEAAREALKRKRQQEAAESATGAVTESVTDTVTDL